LAGNGVDFGSTHNLTLRSIHNHTESRDAVTTRKITFGGHLSQTPDQFDTVTHFNSIPLYDSNF
jgi:hypothetical protein